MATKMQALARMKAQPNTDDDAYTAIAYSAETAWIRNRATGNTWEVTGAVLERTLANPTDYELLVKDKHGNMVGERGDIVIAAQKDNDEDF